MQGVIAIHLNLSFANFSMSHKHASQGYALFEVLIAWAITTAVAVWGANLWVHQAQESAAEATSVWLLGIKQAMDLAVLDARYKIHLHQGKVDLEQIQGGSSFTAFASRPHPPCQRLCLARWDLGAPKVSRFCSSQDLSHFAFSCSRPFPNHCISKDLSHFAARSHQ